MKRTFHWDFKAVVPILGFDFRVTVVALQAVRGHILANSSWPENLPSEHRILANFLDLPITPTFLAEDADFTPFENRYTSKITELTGFPSKSKNFQAKGKTFRDFAEHRLGTSIEGALFLCLKNFNRDGRACIPSLVLDGDIIDSLKMPVTATDMSGITQAMEILLNSQLETGSKIIQMNPTIEQEFPFLARMNDPASVGKTFEDLVSDAVYSCPVQKAVATV